MRRRLLSRFEDSAVQYVYCTAERVGLFLSECNVQSTTVLTVLKEEVVMSHALRIHDGLGQIAVDPSAGILLAYGSTVPAAASEGYAPGCQFIKTNGTGLGTMTYVNVGTKASASFVALGLGGALAINFVYGEATPLDASFFVVSRALQVQSIIVRPLVVGSDGGAVTATVRKAPSGTAIASGTLLHSGSADLKGTINTNQTLTLSTTASDILLAAGDAIGLDVTGTTTAARGSVSVLLLPV